MEPYDVIAIGGGTAGLVTAAGAAGLGARTALIEQHRLGGECLWTGCVPSKALLAAARAAAAVRGAERFGVRTGKPEIDFARVMEWVRNAQARIAPNDSPERFRSLGVDVVQGTAAFRDARTIEVDGRAIRARNIVIATGSRPFIPPIDGLDTIDYHTNETIFTIDEQPRALLVLGAGPVGLELAQAFARLGSAVTVLEEAGRLLPREDAELAAQLGELLARDGVQLRLGFKASRAQKNRAGLQLSEARGIAYHGDALLVATGRRPNLDALQPERAGIAWNEHGVNVDSKLQTSATRIWAAGDVTGALNFTHVADYQARLVLRNALFPFSAMADYANVPWVTFTDPELAHVGLTEEEARAQIGDSVRVWRRPFRELDRAIVDGRDEGMVKLIADKRGNLLGGHVLGYNASSLISEVALAMRQRISMDQLAHTIHAYPTYPEAIRQAAQAQQRARFTGTTKKLVQWWVRR